MKHDYSNIFVILFKISYGEFEPRIFHLELEI